MAIVNYIKICERNIAGNMYLFLTEVSNIFSVTITSGEVSDITMLLSTSFKQIQADTDGIIRQCIKQGGKTKTSYDHLVDFTCSNARLALLELADQLAEASACGIVAIVMDSNGKGWLIGWSENENGNRPLYLADDEFNSGGDPAEPEAGKERFRLFGMNGYKDLPLNATLNAYILSEIASSDGAAIELLFTQPSGGPTADSTIITADSTLYTADETI